MVNQVEIWKAHPEYAGIEVSTLGRVRTLDRILSSVRRTYLKKGRFLNQSENADGYLRVSIEVGGKWTMKSVHQLVAQTFITNPESLPEINHKNCIRDDNRVSNLEWCNHSYNVQYREKFGKAQGHPLFAINLSTLEVYWYPVLREASRKLGVSAGNISSVISGRYKQTGGYWFVNADENAVDIIKKNLHDVGKTGLKVKCQSVH